LTIRALQRQRSSRCEHRARSEREPASVPYVNHREIAIMVHRRFSHRTLLLSEPHRTAVNAACGPRDSIIGIAPVPSRRSALLRPRGARLTALTARSRSRDGQLPPARDAAELLKRIDDDQRRRYARFVRPVAPRSRFASPGAKLIRFIGRRPRTSLPLLPSFPWLPTRAVPHPRRGQSESRRPATLRRRTPRQLRNRRRGASRAGCRSLSTCCTVAHRRPASMPGRRSGVARSAARRNRSTRAEIAVDLRVGQAYHGRETTSTTRTTAAGTRAATRVPRRRLLRPHRFTTPAARSRYRP